MKDQHINGHLRYDKNSHDIICGLLEALENYQRCFAIDSNGELIKCAPNLSDFYCARAAIAKAKGA